MKLKLISTLALLIALQFAVPARAAAALPAPDAQVKTTIQRVKDLVQAQPDKNSVVLDQNLKSELFPMFDFDQMARSSLGANWQKATPADQKEFVRLFSELLSRTYLKRIKSGVSTSQIEVAESKVDGDKAIVKSTVVADGERVAIDYRLQAEKDKWRVYDVIIENVGLISNYRTEFGGIIRKNGMSGLLDQLRSKATEKK